MSCRWNISSDRHVERAHSSCIVVFLDSEVTLKTNCASVSTAEASEGYHRPAKLEERDIEWGLILQGMSDQHRQHLRRDAR
jgi:hypothetical protein